jgi:hypothetical protein
MVDIEDTGLLRRNVKAVARIEAREASLRGRPAERFFRVPAGFPLMAPSKSQNNPIIYETECFVL